MSLKVGDFVECTCCPDPVDKIRGTLEIIPIAPNEVATVRDSIGVPHAVMFNDLILASQKISAGHKYKPGDMVYEKTAKEKAVIKTINGYIGNEPAYWVEYDNTWLGSAYCAESQLTLMDEMSKQLKFEIKCTCGSEITYGETGMHSTWCDKFKEN